MAQNLSFHISHDDLGRSSIVVGVGKAGKLTISTRSLEWRGAGKKRVVRWDELAKLLSPGPAKGKRRKKAKKGGRKAKAGKRTRKVAKGGARGALAGLVAGGQRLVASYHGKKIEARTTNDGQIALGGKKYPSPTAAADAIVKVGRRNGWQFWRLVGPSGSKPLQTLRRAKKR